MVMMMIALIVLNSPRHPVGQVLYYTHFTDKKLKAREATKMQSRGFSDLDLAPQCFPPWVLRSETAPFRLQRPGRRPYGSLSGALLHLTLQAGMPPSGRATVYM